MENSQEAREKIQRGLVSNKHLFVASICILTCAVLYALLTGRTSGIVFYFFFFFGISGIFTSRKETKKLKKELADLEKEKNSSTARPEFGLPMNTPTDE